MVPFHSFLPSETFDLERFISNFKRQTEFSVCRSFLILK